jgi:hypothetical protein
VLQDLNYIGSIVLVLAVFRQIRPTRMTIRSVLWPLVVIAAVLYGFRGNITFSTQSNSMLMVVIGALVGVILGALCGFTTRVFSGAAGQPMAQVGVAAVVFWLIGMAGRLAFVVYVQNGGTQTVGQWTTALHMAPSTWVPLLLLMALGEILARTAVLTMKMQLLNRSGGQIVGANT